MCDVVGAGVNGLSWQEVRKWRGEERRDLFTLKHNISEHLKSISFKENGKM